MKKLIAQRYAVRHNLIAVICLCLTVYFAWHALLGERSAFRLVMLNHELAQTQQEVTTLHAQRVAIEGKVVRLRPGSLDPDMLEERAQIVLGFAYPTENVLLAR